MKIKIFLVSFLISINCLATFSQEVEWKNISILSYSYSNNKDYFLVFLVSPNDYFCNRMLNNLNRNYELVNFINNNFVPILIDINEFNQTIILGKEIFHSKPEIAYGLSWQDIYSLSTADEIDEDILLLSQDFVDHYYISLLDFLKAAEKYIDFENVVYWRAIIENKSIKETKKSKSDLVYKYFKLSKGIPQILILNKKKEIIFNFNGYHNSILLFNGLSQIID
jgi:thioredoxin-related protein